jgi:hypothetical protein
MTGLHLLYDPDPYKCTTYMYNRYNSVLYHSVYKKNYIKLFIGPPWG